VRVADGFSPGDHYALTKVCGEAMAEMYARLHSLSVVSARIGWFVRDEREAAHMARIPSGQRIYLSRADCVEFVACALAAEVTGHVAAFVTSLADPPSADLAEARRLGYEPKQRWPEGLPWPVPTA
jgi:hypothetical protein